VWVQKLAIAAARKKTAAAAAVAFYSGAVWLVHFTADFK